MEGVSTFTHWLCDLDGVLISDDGAIDGAADFLKRLSATEKSYLVLTNNSLFSPEDLHKRLASMGLDVAPELFWTSALATARYVHDQRPDGTAFVIGEASMHEAMSEVGYRVNRSNPDYVVLGETQHYDFDEIALAVQLVERGARFIATNPEPTGPSENGSLPACGALAALIERSSGVSPYFVGKPNTLMLREGLDTLGGHSGSAVMIGDRMETDIHAGVECGLSTILVLSGVTTAEDVARYPYRPGRIIDSVAELIDEL
jgi:NagD protein